MGSRVEIVGKYLPKNQSLPHEQKCTLQESGGGLCPFVDLGDSLCGCWLIWW